MSFDVSMIVELSWRGVHNLKQLQTVFPSWGLDQEKTLISLFMQIGPQLMHWDKSYSCNIVMHTFMNSVVERRQVLWVTVTNTDKPWNEMYTAV